MHVLLMMRADQLEGCTENSEDMVCLYSVNTSALFGFNA